LIQFKGLFILIIMLKYKRILLKLSGEVLEGNQGFGIDQDALNYFVSEIKSVYDEGTGVAVVIGGGNFIRGKQYIGNSMIPKTEADYMGMLSTIINGIALKNALIHSGIPSKLINSFPVEKIGEMYNQSKVEQYLEENFILIFTGGTSNPYFTTDSAAALRAIEIKADLLVKGTKVDGVYSADPMIDKNAIRYETISFDQVYEKNLKIMDLTAITLCKENHIPVAVFNVEKKGQLLSLMKGNNIGTIVS
jgi:uridylate kinase